MSELVPCPQCGKENFWSKDNIYRPFCSERCLLIDFNGWQSEQYSVSGDTEVSD